MIEESEINKFPADKQAQIRKTIADMVSRGYKDRFLMLSERGTVLLDYEAIDIEKEAEALKGL
jgi:hypothetical protein